MDEVSCFETLRAYQGRVFCLREHLGRLGESCRAIRGVMPFSETELAAWLQASLKESGTADAILRCSLHWKGERNGTVAVLIVPFTSHAAELYKKGVELVTGVPRRASFKAQDPQLKTSQFVSGVLAHLDQGPRRPHEIIFFGQAGTVAEGTVSNLFLVKQKTLLTPSVSSGILKGVTRGIILELTRRRGLPLTETFLTRHDLYNADECFITNTSSEVLPVVSVDARVIGAGVPGPMTRGLAEDFKRRVREALRKK